MSLASFDFCTSVPCLPDHGHSNTSAVAGGHLPRLVCQRCAGGCHPLFVHRLDGSLYLFILWSEPSNCPKDAHLCFSSCYIFVRAPIHLSECLPEAGEAWFSEHCFCTRCRLLDPMGSSLYPTHCSSGTVAQCDWVFCFLP